MANFNFYLYQKGPENFYGTLMKSPTYTYKRDGSTFVGNFNSNFSTKFEYPIGEPTLLSTCSLARVNDGGYTLTITCNIPKCVDVYVKKVDYAGRLTILDASFYSITRTENDNNSSLTILIKQIYDETFNSTNAAMDSMYAACLEFGFKPDTTCVNISTKSYNVSIDEVTDLYMDDSKVNYTFMTKPLEVPSYVRIPMRFGNEDANVFATGEKLLIETYTPSRSSNNIKGYYLGRSSSTISNEDVSATRSDDTDHLTLYAINRFLNQTEKNKLDDGEDVNLYLWMRYSAPRQMTPFSARKMRIIKAY
jgi:hypothetical protein